MERAVAKELIHMRGWLARVAGIVARGKADYLRDELLQEAGDSPMMKVGEAANRLARLEVDAPDGIDWAIAVANRNFLIHQYDSISRELTWLTLFRDLAAWAMLLSSLFDEADRSSGASDQ
ncbi:HepT-like ribonuclease domain-containing protein [Tsukamurella ocularis]|uniref:HepT-like ribonuclease domain-containing protein n=1 Tax=Tsukamurella ocularis TaxID=1970234 RepID=UPI0039EEF61E